MLSQYVGGKIYVFISWKHKRDIFHDAAKLNKIIFAKEHKYFVLNFKLEMHQVIRYNKWLF